MTMPKRQPKYTEPAPRIEKLDNVPGPEASGDVLKAHYRRVQDIIATHCYDDVLCMCHWCAGIEAELAFTKTDQPRGTRQYCTARCANAYTAYTQKAVMQGKVVSPPPPGDDAEDDDPPPGTAKPTPTRRKRVKDVTTTVGQEGTGRTTAGKPPAAPPKPVREKPTKARGPKPAREDGKCPRGLHDLTPDNVYERDGNRWCKACKADNRARYIAKQKAAGAA